MTWRITSPVAGFQRITDHSTTKNHPLGTIVQATDDTYGAGEFIYLLGVANTVVGSAVNFSLVTYQTALAVVGNDKSRPVAFAMSANVASEYGWYQIGGLAIAAKNAAVSVATGDAVAVVSTGLVGASASDKEVWGAVVAALASATTTSTTVLLHINRPHMKGADD